MGKDGILILILHKGKKKTCLKITIFMFLFFSSKILHVGKYFKFFLLEE